MIIIAAVIGQFISALPLKLKVVLNVNVCDATVMPLVLQLVTKKIKTINDRAKPGTPSAKPLFLLPKFFA